MAVAVNVIVFTSDALGDVIVVVIVEDGALLLCFFGGRHLFLLFFNGSIKDDVGVGFGFGIGFGNRDTWGGEARRLLQLSLNG